jgi:hypothetical protein
MRLYGLLRACHCVVLTHTLMGIFSAYGDCFGEGEA